MENGRSQEHQPPTPETSEAAKDRGIDALCEQLGFIETDELKSLREQAVEAYHSGDTEGVRDALIGYQLLGEELVNGMQGYDYMQGQIGLIVAKATLHRDTGNIGAFLDDIEDAKTYAFNMQEDDVASRLEKVPSSEIARLLTSFGSEYGFDDETCAEIAAEPYSQAFEIAYGYLMQAGFDADEILYEFMDHTEE